MPILLALRPIFFEIRVIPLALRSPDSAHAVAAPITVPVIKPIIILPFMPVPLSECSHAFSVSAHGINMRTNNWKTIFFDGYYNR